MQLREKIAAEIRARRQRVNDALLDEDIVETADAILAIPEIRDALAATKPVYVLGEMTVEEGSPGNVVRRYKPNGPTS